jgi:hypothetical protein
MERDKAIHFEWMSRVTADCAPLIRRHGVVSGKLLNQAAGQTQT